MDPLGLSRQAHYWSCDGGQRSKFLRQLSANRKKEKKKKKIKKTKSKEGGLVALSAVKFNFLSNLQSAQFSR